VATFNPSKSESGDLPRDTEVSFLPMEAIGDDGTIQLGLTREIGAVEQGYTYFRDGDVVMAKITPCFENGKGALVSGLLGGIGFGTTELIVARPIARLAEGRYLQWLFTSPHFRASATASMYGAGGQKRVPEEFVRNFVVALPALAEQSVIASFLDRETAKIDALVAEQEQLIALLKEKRQAVISQAVTKGLDPNMPMKDSGVEWLGEVPAHWDVVGLRRVIQPERRITYGIVQPGEPDENGRFMVRGQDYSDGWVQPEMVFRVSPAVEEPYRRARLAAGDLIMTIVGAGVGNVATVPEWLNGANITQTTARIAVDPRVAKSEYISVVLQSPIGRRSVEKYAKGAAQPGLNLEHVKLFPIPLPPVAEQQSILQHLEARLSGFEDLLSAAVDGIVLLRERRAALISAAVTGKIDVRDLAAQPEAQAA
jgi:type I restriction enzyme S subunit